MLDCAIELIELTELLPFYQSSTFTLVEHESASYSRIYGGKGSYEHT